MVEINNEKDLLENIKGTGRLDYSFNCLECGKHFETCNFKIKLRKRLESQGYEKFLRCKSCSIKSGISKRTKEEQIAINEKRKKTVIEKYGYKNVFCDTEKIKKSYLNKFGVENPSQLKEVKEKKRETLLNHYGVENPNQSKEIKEKIKSTNKGKYGTEFPIQNETVKKNRESNNLKKYGVKHFSQTGSWKNQIKETWNNQEKRNSISKKVSKTWSKKTEEEIRDIRSKAFKRYEYRKEFFDSSWELAVWIWAKDNNKQIKREPICIEYDYKGETHKYFPDFEIEGKLVEVKGDHFFDSMGNLICPFDRSKDEIYLAKYKKGLEVGVEFWRDEQIKPIMEYIVSKYTENFIPLFDLNAEFPYEEFKPTGDYEIIRYFHKSLNWASKKGKLSPLRAWNDKDLVLKSALNRLKYVGSCSPKNVVKGFSVAQIAPRVSVFKPSIAENLIKKYLNGFNEIVDPFSGFSGRMIGSVNCGKKYIGRDINPDHVRESNEIILYKNYQNCSVEVENLLEKKNVETFDCLFTCPPYGGKEHWNKNNDEIEKSCDEWIDICLEKYKCKKYLFVVDETEKYKNNIVEEIKTKTLYGDRVEYVVLL